MKTIKVAVTGGPSGGKTTLIDAIKKELGSQVAVVPESASILYRGGFPRFKSKHGLIHAQKAIYYTGRELEALMQAEHNPAVLVCDRGSVDSLAYWPEGPEGFFQMLGTTQMAEFDRYDWVVHLDTAGIEQYDGTNPIRTESYLEAQALNQKILDAWSAHPKRIRINQRTDFLTKMATAYGVIQAIIEGQSLSEIRATFE